MTKMRTTMKRLLSLATNDTIMKGLFEKARILVHDEYRFKGTDVCPEGDAVYWHSINHGRNLPERIAIIAYLYATTVAVHDPEELTTKFWHYSAISERERSGEFERFRTNFVRVAKAYCRNNPCLVEGMYKSVDPDGWSGTIYGAAFFMYPRKPESFSRGGIWVHRESGPL